MMSDQELDLFPETEKQEYMVHLDRYRGLKDMLKTADEKIRENEKRDAEDMIEIVRNMKTMKMDKAMIADATGLSEEEIDLL